MASSDTPSNVRQNPRRVAATRGRAAGDEGPVPEENQPGHHPEQEQDKPDLSAVAKELGIPTEDDTDATATSEPPRPRSKQAEAKPEAKPSAPRQREAEQPERAPAPATTGAGSDDDATSSPQKRAAGGARRALRAVPAGVGTVRPERGDEGDRTWFLPVGVATGAVRAALLPARAGLAVTRASLSISLRVVERAERTLGSIGSPDRDTTD